MTTAISVSTTDSAILLTGVPPIEVLVLTQSGNQAQVVLKIVRTVGVASKIGPRTTERLRNSALTLTFFWLE